MPYTRFVQLGRVVLVNYGPDQGKLAVILDVLDQNRVLLDGPTTGVVRQVVPISRISLTSVVIKVSRGARLAAVKKAWTAGKVDETWNKSSWAKKIALKKTRANTTDFDRFKLAIAKKTRSQLANKEFKGLLKSQAKKK